MNDIEEKLREHTGDPNGSFPTIFTFPGKGKIDKKYVLEFGYKKKNRDGSFQKKESYMKVAISYNPFTGEKLYKNDDSVLAKKNKQAAD